ncbi:hypothetical protein NDU88_003347 [Pleurodeles waltl]|uniref:Uncharacterized protein n=1 Tax=Pleurodeles waltl TaxID=8319 RepID=A0AAV7T5A8_PLEWA|nr:hypothetical protein NDU88_003347 [Pleurodeles waltl]
MRAHPHLLILADPTETFPPGSQKMRWSGGAREGHRSLPVGSFPCQGRRCTSVRERRAFRPWWSTPATAAYEATGAPNTQMCLPPQLQVDPWARLSSSSEFPWNGRVRRAEPDSTERQAS